MKMSNRQYEKYVANLSPKSPIGKNICFAFLIGGGICALAQLLQNGYMSLGVEKDAAGTWTSVSVIFVGALLTALSLFDKIAKVAGAGTLVPITGFANAIVAPALEFKQEGFIMGTAGKIFSIAGPVILYGISASVVAGIVFWIIQIV